jgi:hypothetical protein
LRCDNKVDIVVVVPDNKNQPIYALIDSKRRGKPDGVVLASRQSGKWTTSLWDVNLDGTYPLRGVHPDGELMPSRFVPRCGSRGRPLKDFRCA